MNESHSKPQRILITGASGLIGRALVPFLQAGGHTVRTIGRSAGADVKWNPERNQLEAASLEGTDVAIHLAGEPLLGRWTARKRQAIMDSRQHGTELLSKTLAALRPRPKVLISASAVGFYGDRGDNILTENDAPGSGFLSQVCVAWEEATQAAERAGVRVVHLRIGVVASSRGGAFVRMLLPYRFGVGQQLGNGRQYLSWIALPDLLRIIAYCHTEEALQGPVNAVAPEPVTNSEFARAAAGMLHRRTLPALPVWSLRAILGEMAKEVLLSSTRAMPEKLLQRAFRFQYPVFVQALEAVIRDQV